MGSERRLRESFGRRFEPTSDGFLYRRVDHGTGIAVTAAEQARFAAVFECRLRWVKWVFNGWAFWSLVVGLTYLAYRLLPTETAHGSLFGAIVLAIVVFAAVEWWLVGAPARELRGRPIAAPARGWRETYRRDLATLSWSRVIGDAALAALVLVAQISERDRGPLHFIFLALTGCLLMLALVRLALKGVRAARRPH